MEPHQNGQNAYTLLLQALKKSHKVGVGSFVMRNKEILGIVKPYQGVLIVNRIRFPEELRGYEELHIPVAKAKSNELKMAVDLIDMNTKKFNPAQYKDTYRADLLKIIKQKAKGQKLKVVEARESSNTTTDLMEQLKASLEKSKKNIS